MFIKLNGSLYNQDHISHVSRMFYQTKDYEGYVKSSDYVIEIELSSGAIMKMRYKMNKTMRDTDFDTLSNYLKPHTVIGSYNDSDNN